MHWKTQDELEVMADVDRRAAAYIAGIGSRPVYPTADAIAALRRFDEPLPERGCDARETLQLLDEVGSPGAVESNGARYFGFVTGASLPVAAAADRLAAAWDNSASTDGAPAVAAVEATAGRWMLEILDLPRDAAVGFTTSAASGTIVALATARRVLLARLGWDVDRDGLTGAPVLRVVASELAHAVVRKALRVLGFGLAAVEWVPADEFGRIDATRIPPLDDRTILILQAGEVNTGEIDDFAAILPSARQRVGWMHVDGAFGLWARASSLKAATEGVELADSWTVDGHKWLNTPYDSAAVIVRDRDAIAAAMRSDAAYSPATSSAQMHLTLEFSRRARGVPIWAALRTLGRSGVAELIESTVALADAAAEGLRAAGYRVLNRVLLNQVLVAADTPDQTLAIVAAAQASGSTWFGATVWSGEPAFRLSVSSWRTRRHDIDDLVRLLARLRREHLPAS